MTTSHDLLLGTRDWAGPLRAGIFYPDDLPAEWRLTYYANEYRTVLVPTPRWRGADWAQWRADTPAEFRFVIEVDADDIGFAAMVDVVAALRERVGAILVRNGTRLIEAPERVDGLLQQLAHLGAVVLDVAAAAPATKLLRRWNAGVLWRPGYDRALPGPVAVGLIEGGPDMTPRYLRNILEEFVNFAGGARDRALFFEAHGALNSAKTLASLLGY